MDSTNAVKQLVFAISWIRGPGRSTVVNAVVNPDDPTKLDVIFGDGDKVTFAPVV